MINLPSIKACSPRVKETAKEPTTSGMEDLGKVNGLIISKMGKDSIGIWMDLSRRGYGGWGRG